MANLTNSGNLIDAINSKQNLIIQSANQPSNPNTWDYRYDTTNKLLKYYNWSSWDAVWANVRVLTQSEYDQLTPAEKSNWTLYLITWDSDQLTIAWENVTDKPTFATVATSGAYNDLSWKPTIPTVNDTTITFTQNWVSVWDITLNQSSAETIALTDTTYTAGTWIDITNWVISNTQTSAERWNITWTLSDQTDLNTALNAKANDADVVKLTWAQTVAWTKMFQDEPLVPSKTRAAIYHWQKIATEAQVYAKQDKLTIGDWLKMEWTTLSVIKEPVEYSWGAWITITKWWDYSAMRGPAPVWFHVPSIEDRQWLKSIMDWLTFSRQSWAAWMDVLKLAPAGLIDFDIYTPDHQWKNPEHQWYGLFYRSSTPVIWTTRANSIQLDAASINIPSTSFRTYWYSIRCFKDSFVVPTSSWTVLNWTLWSAWVFWDSANWLISVTWNGTTWYTIMDKNLWADTVYNYWATCTESNCWKYYQRWNNFWFDYAWPEYTTQVVVDASSYWPGNYYSFDEFFFWDVDWTDPSNDNLRWWVTWAKDSISNSWVTSVNWQTWDVSISSAEWWNITWTLSNQTDLNTALASKVWSSNNTINNVIHLSQADYDALATKDENTWYSTPDGASWWFEPENAWSSGQVLTKTSTWYNWATLSTWRSLSKTMVNNQLACVWPWTAIELSYETTRAWFLTLEWQETTSWGSSDQSFSVDWTSYFWWPTQPAWDEITRCVVSVNGTNYYPDMTIVHRVIMAVWAYSTVTAHLENFSSAPSGVRSYLKFCDFFYFE